MSTKAPKLYCSRCKTEVSYHQLPVEHHKEFFRTLVTVGLWLPMWLLATFVRTNICDACGNAIDPG
jgi:hypothetical protein